MLPTSQVVTADTAKATPHNTVKQELEDSRIIYEKMINRPQFDDPTRIAGWILKYLCISEKVPDLPLVRYYRKSYYIRYREQPDKTMIETHRWAKCPEWQDASLADLIKKAVDNLNYDAKIATDARNVALITKVCADNGVPIPSRIYWVQYLAKYSLALEKAPEIKLKTALSISHLKSVENLIKNEITVDYNSPVPVWLKPSNISTDNILQCRNGLLDISNLTDRSFLGHSPAYFTIEVPMDVDYDATAPYPINIMKPLDYQFGSRYLDNGEPNKARDNKSIAAILEYIGHTMTTGVKLKQFIIIHGDSDSGKSTWINAILNIIGRANMAPLDLKALAYTFGLENTIGKKLILFNDVRAKDSEDTGNCLAYLLPFCGGDAMPVQCKYDDTDNNMSNAKIIWICNFAPNFRDVSKAMANRILYIYLPRGAVDIIDRNLESKMATDIEKSGFLNIALDNLANLRDRGNEFDPPDYSKRFLDSLQYNASPINQWIDDCLIIADNDHDATYFEVIKTVAFNSYRAYCAAIGVHGSGLPNFERDFYEIMKQRYKEARRKVVPSETRSRVFTGIILNDEGVSWATPTLEYSNKAVTEQLVACKAAVAAYKAKAKEREDKAKADALGLGVQSPDTDVA